jgi:RNA polymerase sigma-70 factor (ECF subfamily)
LRKDEGRSESVRFAWLNEACAAQAEHHDQIVYLESRDALRRLKVAVLKLKPKTREIFIARRVHGLTYAEISEITGLSAKAIEKHMAQAIAKAQPFHGSLLIGDFRRVQTRVADPQASRQAARAG